MAFAGVRYQVVCLRGMACHVGKDGLLFGAYAPPGMSGQQVSITAHKKRGRGHWYRARLMNGNHRWVLADAIAVAADGTDEPSDEQDQENDRINEDMDSVPDSVARELAEALLAMTNHQRVELGWDAIDPAVLEHLAAIRPSAARAVLFAATGVELYQAADAAREVETVLKRDGKVIPRAVVHCPSCGLALIADEYDDASLRARRPPPATLTMTCLCKTVVWVHRTADRARLAAMRMAEVSAYIVNWTRNLPARAIKDSSTAGLSTGATFSAEVDRVNQCIYRDHHLGIPGDVLDLLERAPADDARLILAEAAHLLQSAVDSELVVQNMRDHAKKLPLWGYLRKQAVHCIVCGAPAPLWQPTELGRASAEGHHSCTVVPGRRADGHPSFGPHEDDTLLSTTSATDVSVYVVTTILQAKQVWQVTYVLTRSGDNTTSDTMKTSTPFNAFAGGAPTTVAASSGTTLPPSRTSASSARTHPGTTSTPLPMRPS